MDKDKSGKVDINDIRQSYNAKQHPDVKSGKKTEDEILGEFLDTFEDHFCDMKGHEDARDGVITMDEWLEYYNNVSMSIDDDEYFALMMNNAWNLDGKKVTKKGWDGMQDEWECVVADWLCWLLVWVDLPAPWLHDGC